MYIPFLDSSNKTDYVEERSLNQGGKLVSDALQATDILKINILYCNN